MCISTVHAEGGIRPFCWVSTLTPVLSCKGEEGSVTSREKLCFKGSCRCALWNAQRCRCVLAHLLDSLALLRWVEKCCVYGSYWLLSALCEAVAERGKMLRCCYLAGLRVCVLSLAELVMLCVAPSPCPRTLKQCCGIHSGTSGKFEAWPKVEREVPNKWLLGKVEAE